MTPAGIAGTVLLTVVVLVCVRLGFWQLSRLAERREMNAAIAARLDREPLGDVAHLRDSTGLSYRTATASGWYDNARHIILPGRAHRGVPGVHLVMPLRLAGRHDAVLVNRGWVPSADAATIDAADFAVHDSVLVSGLILPFPGRGQSLAQRETTLRSDTFRHVLYTIDDAALRAQFPYPLLDFMLQELEAAGGARYPTRLEPPPLDPGPHLGYALQWFGFAIIGVIGWFALVLRRRPPRPPAATISLLAVLLLPGTASAQLRPLEPLDWRVFDRHVAAVAEAGAGVLHDQPATLAGTRGTLFEIGTWSLSVRSARMAIQLGGTALWRLEERDTVAAAAAGVGPATGVRQETGPVFAATAFRMSPDSWPVDVLLRFGATLPTTSDESGLDRDRTDVFALISTRFRSGPLALTAENGVGINGSLNDRLPQTDVWTYAFGASYRVGLLRLAGGIVGRQDGQSAVVRGNEDLRELRTGFDIGRARWLRVRYIRGLESRASPAHGLRVSAGMLLERGN